MNDPIQTYLDHIRRLEDFAGQWVHHQCIPASDAKYADFPHLNPNIITALNRLGITRLYSHQAQAIKLVKSGRNVAVVTPTASGKTEIYNIPVLESILNDPSTKALYLFPLKALEQDQLQRFQSLADEVTGDHRITAAIYDGDTSSSQRTKIRKNFPNVIFTNPDMLHQGIMAYHGAWENFFADLKFVIVDELHTYKGIFGCHVVQLFRRLNRICRFHRRAPQYICLSATIHNPKELAQDLTGMSFELIERSGAPRLERHFLFLNPDLSPNTIAAKLLTIAIDQKLRTIVFTKARVSTELIHRNILYRRPELAPVISSYRAGFLPEERREIEGKLQSGKILGVISTSALELGIDIGGLDLCILVGYPGTIATTWQRSGRVGRKNQPSAVILIAQQNALDQYFMRHPQDFFGRSFEAAIVNRDNEEILKSHLESAAAEIPLMADDDQFDIEKYSNVIDQLVADGRLIQGASGKQYFAPHRNPSRHVSIRSVGDTFAIFEQDTNARIGEVNGFAVYRECHQGAIYLHRARQYQVIQLDLQKHNVWVRQMNSPYYTQPQTNKNTEILETIDTITNCLITAHRGIVKVTEQVVGYEKRKVFTGERISVHPLELPPMTFVGQGIWLEIPRPMLDELILHDLHPMGSIHATEHAVLSLMPLFALCDRNDVGGISFELNSQVGAGAIFFYDGYPGGAGLAWRAFDVLKPLLEKTLSLIRDCPCELGCPSCIHSPKCGSGNHPLDKQGSIQLLEWLLGNTFQPSENHEKPERVIEPAIETQSPHTENIVENSTTEPSQSPFPNDFQILTFDLETQLSAEEVGGWEMARHMRLAVGVIHDSTDDKFHIYDEKSADELIEHLHRANLVVGFNLIRFDYQVLRGYTMDNLQSLPTLDILKEISNSLGYRLTLDSLATTTLGVTKIADGLQSLEWVRQGRMDLVTDYCQKDVEITRDLFLYGVKNGYLLYNRKGMGDVRVQVNWSWDRLRAISQSP